MKIKRILTFLMVAILLLLAATPAAALTQEELLFIQQFTPPQGNGVLYIDSDYLYPGMDSTYAAGYTPKVEGDTAHVVLPLITGAAASGIANDTVSLSVNLGQPSSAPFKFNNYDKNVKWSTQAAVSAAGKDASRNAFFAAFDFALEPEESRVVGKYPVYITARYNLTNGDAVSQNFLLYVTVETGLDPDEPQPSPDPEPQPVPEPEPTVDPGADGGSGGGGGGGGGVSSQPKVFISNYEVSPDIVYAGELFTVKVRLKNSSKTSTVKNITVVYKSEKDLMPGAGTNTAYIEKIGKDEVAEFSFTMEARADAEPGPQKISMDISYEDSASSPLTASDEVTVQIRQKIRLEYDEPQFPTQLYMGDSFSASLNLYNKGKNILYNVTVMLDVPGLIPDSSSFLGNMESGSAKTADMYGSVLMGGAGDMGGMEEGEGTFVEGDMIMDGAGVMEEGALAESGVAAAAEEIEGMDAPEVIMDGSGDFDEGGYMDVMPGPVEGNFVVTYEDEYGEAYEMLIPVSTQLMEMPDYSGNPEEEMPPEEMEQGGLPWWGWVIIAVVAAVVVTIIVRGVKKKKRAKELAEDMEDDDVY